MDREAYRIRTCHAIGPRGSIKIGKLDGRNFFDIRSEGPNGLGEYLGFAQDLGCRPLLRNLEVSGKLELFTQWGKIHMFKIIRSAQRQGQSDRISHVHLCGCCVSLDPILSHVTCKVRRLSLQREIEDSKV